MTTYDSPRLAAETTLAASFSTLPVANDNLATPAGEFVRIINEPGAVASALIGGGNTNLSLGKNVVQRHAGAVVFEINVEKNQGTARANAIAEELSVLFANKRIDDVVFRNSEIVRTGELENLYQLSLFVYYYRDSR